MSRSNQDALISEDEDEMDCPLCMEELDISDKNFKPCECGYQVCRFCWHHIKHELNGRCPACRRLYSEQSVQWKPVTAEEWKTDNYRKNERKKTEKERKELEAVNRKHLANMRVVQKNLVYVNGLSPKMANDDLISTLRGPDYFGQYGKIAKLVVNKKNATSTGGYVGIYITYHRKEDAARAIAAVDGSMNDGKLLRASYGTTKYCTAYLRNQPCPNPGCMYLHEPGEDIDSFTKEDLATIQHTAKMGSLPGGTSASRNLAAQSRPVKTTEQSATNMEMQPSTDSTDSALPATASWAKLNQAVNQPQILPKSYSARDLATSAKQHEKGNSANKSETERTINRIKQKNALFENVLNSLCKGTIHFEFAAEHVFPDADATSISQMPPFFVWDLDAAKQRVLARKEKLEQEKQRQNAQSSMQQNNQAVEALRDAPAGSDLPVPSRTNSDTMRTHRRQNSRYGFAQDSSLMSPEAAQNAAYPMNVNRGPQTSSIQPQGPNIRNMPLAHPGPSSSQHSRSIPAGQLNRGLGGSGSPAATNPPVSPNLHRQMNRNVPGSLDSVPTGSISVPLGLRLQPQDLV